MKKSKNNKLLKSAIVLISLTIGAIALAKTINAETLGNWNGGLTSGMPSTSIHPETGYFPQTTGNGIIFCNDQSSVVRFGSKDYNKYYPTKEEYGSSLAYSSASDPALIAELKEEAEHRINTYLNSHGYDLDGSISYPGSISINWTVYEPENADSSKPLMMVIVPEGVGEDQHADQSYVSGINRALAVSEKSLDKKFDELSGEEKPQDLLDGYDSEVREYVYQIEKQGQIYLGPQVAVMGTGDASNYSNKSSQSIDTRSTSTYKDIMNAYILTGEYHKGRQNTAPYDLIDVQVANWLNNDDNHNFGGNMSLPHGYITDANGTITADQTLTQGSGTRGQELYDEARDYYEFVLELKANGGYVATVNTGDTQVFASRDDGNRNNDEYVIGPVSITYPYYHNISYLTDIILETKNDDGQSAELSYKNSDFEIVMETQGDTKLTGGNIYPGENGKENETFYIIVNASKANYPDTINIKAEFEYTDYCKAKYNILYASGGKVKIWRYVEY